MSLPLSYRPTQPPQEEPKRPKGIIKTQRHKLDNVEAHMEDIMELVEENEDYKLSKKEIIESGLEDEKIYEYELSGKTELLLGRLCRCWLFLLFRE